MINLVYIIIVHSSLKENYIKSQKVITVFWFVATLVTKKKEDLMKYHNNRTCLKKGQLEAKGNVH